MHASVAYRESTAVCFTLLLSATWYILVKFSHMSLLCVVVCASRFDFDVKCLSDDVLKDPSPSVRHLSHGEVVCTPLRCKTAVCLASFSSLCTKAFQRRSGRRWTYIIIIVIIIAIYWPLRRRRRRCRCPQPLSDPPLSDRAIHSVRPLRDNYLVQRRRLKKDTLTAAATLESNRSRNVTDWRKHRSLLSNCERETFDWWWRDSLSYSLVRRYWNIHRPRNDDACSAIVFIPLTTASDAAASHRVVAAPTGAALLHSLSDCACVTRSHSSLSDQNAPS